MVFFEKQGQGIPIVFIHGFGFNRHCFDGLIGFLKQNFSCIAIDLPGFGDSTYKAYDLNGLIDDIQAILPDTQIHILGWSLGGMIALAYAARYPAQVNSFISVASNPCFIGCDGWPGMPMQAFHFFAKQCRRDYKKAQLLFAELQKASNITNESFDTHDMVFDLNCCQDAVSNALEILEKHDLRKEMQALKVPCLSFLGKYDQLVPLEIIKPLQALNSNNQIVLFDDSAHAPFLTQTTLFIQTLETFLCSL